VGSRVLIGVGAWLLGAAAATASSLYAVAQLGQGLVEQHSSQVSVAMVNAELAQDGAPRTENAVLSPSPSASPKVSHSSARRRSGRKNAPNPPVMYASKVLTSDGGWAAAACGPDGARLLRESPALGFTISPRIVRGPGTVASVTFTDTSTGVIMKVTCSAGVPVAQVSDFNRGGWGPHDDK
jgi:hypothetical protein